MGVIKIENADPQSSHPLVFDVMSTDESATEPLATHVLKFGDFVVVGSLENIKMVSPAEKAERDAAALAETTAAEKQAQADNLAVQQQATSLSAAATDYPAEAEPATARYKRSALEDMTKDDLQGIADDHDIEIHSHATKAEMVDAIMKGQ
jgi:hypothetical protein